MTKVLGMGNALVDIMTSLKSDDTLKSFSLPKGSMQLVDENFIGKVLQGTEDLEREESAGGSAANTIHGLAKMGVETAFIGKVGGDRFGDFFRDDMKKSNIKPLLSNGDAETGRAVALVSPDSERTFATYLGAAIELSLNDLEVSQFDGYTYFHIEGYLVQNHDLIRKAVQLAKEKGLKVSLDLASYNVVEDNLAFLQDIVKDYVDIVFANEEEAKAFTGKEPEGALDAIAEVCDIAVVKIGSKGSLIKKDGKTYKVGVISVESKDTTGAGDLYAAGFLYGLVKGMPLDKCGYNGAVLGGKVIEVIGAKMSENAWTDAKGMINA